MEKRQSIATAGRAAGGYKSIGVPEIVAAWSAYRTKHIRLLDLRVWLACHEMLARRCAMRNDRKARYTLGEIGQLLGSPHSRGLKAAINRLVAAQLLSWAPDSIQMFAPAVGSTDCESEFHEMLNSITNHKRQVPIPRRMLRCLCRRGTRSLIATVLGHSFRCIYLRGGKLNPVGSCKASWIASTFGVHVRSIKASRRRLYRSGWIRLHAAQQWRLNRFGAVVEVNLHWGKGRATSRAGSVKCTVLPPPTIEKCTDSPLPVSDRNLPSEFKNQKPTERRPAGAYGGLQSRNHPRPCWQRITIADLTSHPRLLVLFDEAVARRLIERTEAARLRFVAAAQHALAAGQTNPCGLFVAVVKRGLWAHITQADEERARLLSEPLKRQPTESARIGNRAVGFQPASHPRPTKLTKIGSMIDQMGAFATNYVKSQSVIAVQSEIRV